MKRILFFLSSLIISVSLFAESGNGTIGNPYYGTISTTVQWSTVNYPGATVYVGTATNPDLAVGNGGHLTIDPGITVIFTQLTSDLFITGTGQLTAGGIGAGVIFTKNPTLSHWGHISFQSMGTNPAASSFYNCLFEWGYSTGSSGQPTLAGGALQVDFNNVTITSCTFLNNFASFAGALMINTGRNTIVKNSYFKSNRSNECGGAIITYLNSTALIENCIFEQNYSKGTSSALYSGGAIWIYTNTTKIINCTFVKNTSDRPGDAVYSYGATSSKIYNSIFWGSNDQYAGNAGLITNCAFESLKPSSAIYSLIINSVNSAADGPNFKATDGTDWEIKVISPCRDAGTTPVPAVPTDYIDNSRIGAYDIGAYEVQYNMWKTTAGSSDWNTPGNWDMGVPTSTQNVVIPTGASNYPTGSTALNYTIGSGYGLVIDPQARATFGTVTNNGDLKMRADASNISSLITANSVSAILELYLTGGGNPNYRWHYISIPVSDIDTNVFWKYTIDLARYISNRPSTTASQGWVAADGYVYSDRSQDNQYAFSKLYLRQGYNYYLSSDRRYTFSGMLNKDTVNSILAYKSGNNLLYGFNLLGNPFSSGLNWDIVTDGSVYAFPANTSKSVYFTKDNVQYSYINGVGTPFGTTGIIPPMQGFFVKTNSAGNIIRFPVEARTHTAIHARYKSKTLIPLVRLTVPRDSVFNHFPVFKDSVLTHTGYDHSVIIDSVVFDHVNYDDAVVRFDDLALSSLDDDFDALKMFITTDRPYIYSSVSSVNYAINGIPFPSTSVEIPIVVYFNKTGNHKLSVTELQGLDSYNVQLIDNTTGFTTDLKTTPFITFSSDSGVLTNRFVLKVGTIITGINDPIRSVKNFSIYSSDAMINVIPMDDDWTGKTGTVTVFDLTGKLIRASNNISFQKNEIISFPAPSIPGIYIVKVNSGALRHISKVVVN